MFFLTLEELKCLTFFQIFPAILLIASSCNDSFINKEELKFIHFVHRYTCCVHRIGPMYIHCMHTHIHTVTHVLNTMALSNNDGTHTDTQSRFLSPSTWKSIPHMPSYAILIYSAHAHAFLKATDLESFV